MKQLLICFVLLTPLRLISASHAELLPDIPGRTKREYHEFYIFNATTHASFFIRLRENTPPWRALRSSSENLKEIYELPPQTSIKVLYTLKENDNLRLRVWPHSERSFIQLRDKKCELYAFKGKILKAGANVLLFTYYPLWQKANASKSLSKKKYRIGRSLIDKQPDTSADESLCVISTESSDITTFKQDLAEALKQSDRSIPQEDPPPFQTIHELKIREGSCTLSPFNDDY